MSTLPSTTLAAAFSIPLSSSVSLFIQNFQSQIESAFLVNKLHFPIPIFSVRFAFFHQFLFVFLSVHFARP